MVGMKGPGEERSEGAGKPASDVAGPEDAPLNLLQAINEVRQLFRLPGIDKRTLNEIKGLVLAQDPSPKDAARQEIWRWSYPGIIDLLCSYLPEKTRHAFKSHVNGMFEEAAEIAARNRALEKDDDPTPEELALIWSTRRVGWFSDTGNNTLASGPAATLQQARMGEDFTKPGEDRAHDLNALAASLGLTFQEAAAKILAASASAAAASPDPLRRARRIVRRFDRLRAKNLNLAESPEVKAARRLVNRSNYQNRKANSAAP
jgi:hypothetical protein